VFDYVSENEPSIRAVWLSRDRDVVADVRKSGKEAYLTGSWRGYWLCCRAYLSFVTCGLPDVNRPGACRAKRIQLWHGTPLKKIGLDDRVSHSGKRSAVYRLLKWISRTFFPFTIETCDIVISPSRLISRRLETAFGVDPANVVVTGYPRGDVILDPEPKPVVAVERFLDQWQARRVVCYMPTHRCEGRQSFDAFAGLDKARLKACLARHNAAMFVKMHYFHREHDFSDFPDYRVHWLCEVDLDDVNRMLPFVDVLITDYSSVYFDHLLLDRPIIFAPFDKERYLTVDREMYEDYDAATPGPKCINWDEVIEELDCILGGVDSHVSSRRDARERYNTYRDTNNCYRVTELAKSVAGLPSSWIGEELRESIETGSPLVSSTRP
jgi:CDP-glycerol glycerophosphotransferase (TagB/SpsB family)